MFIFHQVHIFALLL